MKINELKSINDFLDFSLLTDLINSFQYSFHVYTKNMQPYTMIKNLIYIPSITTYGNNSNKFTCARSQN